MLANLLEMPTVGTQRRDRITSDEEERMRMGYDTRTNYRFAQGSDGQLRRRSPLIISRSPLREELDRPPPAPPS